MMQKKKQVRRVNKTCHVPLKKQQGKGVEVLNIMKEIGQLKKELVSIKSKKCLYTKQKDQEQQYLHNIIGNTNRQIEEEATVTKMKNKHKAKPEHFQTFNSNSEGKQNVQGCQCQNSDHEATKSKKVGRSMQPLRIQLTPITSPKSRQTKLKLNIQLNKIKSALEKMYIDTGQAELVQVLVAELNTTMAYLDSSFKQYEHELVNRRAEYKQIKSELTELSENMIKLAQRNSREKNISSVHVSQISQLKRHLSYYLHTMQDSKEEAEKYQKQVQSLEAYIKELQNSNRLLRRQQKQEQQKTKKLQSRTKILQSQGDQNQKQMKLLQEDKKLLQKQLDSTRAKKKQSQKNQLLLSAQLEQLQQKYNIKQYQLTKMENMCKELSEAKQRQQNNLQEMVGSCKQKQIQILQLNLSLASLEKEVGVLVEGKVAFEKNIRLKDQEVKDLRSKLNMELKEKQKLAQSLSFCEQQINNLSEEIHSLKQANERYKNKYFRNKLVKGHHDQQKDSPSIQSSPMHKTNRQSQSSAKKDGHSHRKNRQRILGEIQQLIQKHKKQSDGSSSESDFESY